LFKWISILAQGTFRWKIEESFLLRCSCSKKIRQNKIHFYPTSGSISTLEDMAIHPQKLTIEPEHVPLEDEIPVGKPLIFRWYTWPHPFPMRHPVRSM